MAKKQSYKYINGIRNNVEKVLTEMIQAFRLRIIASLKRNGVNKLSTRTAEDLFYEGLEAVVEKVMAVATFKLSDRELYNYTQKVCINKLKNNLNDEGRDNDMISGLVPAIEEDIGEEVEKETNMFMEKFNQLDQDCQDVLWYTYVDKTRDREIAEIKGYKEAFVRLKRLRCKNKLQKLLKK